MLPRCYDGSPDSQAAVDYAARFFAGRRVTVLTVWESFIDVLVHSATGAAYVPAMVDVQEIDQVTEKQALATATEGAERATGGPIRVHCLCRQSAIASKSSTSGQRRRSPLPRR